MDWTMPILARDSYVDQRIEVQTQTAVLVSAIDRSTGEQVHVAVNHRGYTDFVLVTRCLPDTFHTAEGRVPWPRVKYDRP